MIGMANQGASGPDIRVLALPAISIAIEFGGNGFSVDCAAGRRTMHGLVTGLAPGPVRVRGEQIECIEMRLRPPQAQALLGISLSELNGEVIGVDDLWGNAVQRLREQLAETPTWEERFARVASFAAQRCRTAQAADPEVTATWHRIVSTRGRARVDDLARSVGWSRKRLWSRFGAQIGVTPKRAVMQVRFRSAVERLVAGDQVADVAAACGYTDQAHLYRDASVFATGTPREFIERLTATESVHAQAWGTFFQD